MHHGCTSSIKSCIRICRNTQKPFCIFEWVLDVQPKKELRILKH